MITVIRFAHSPMASCDRVQANGLQELPYCDVDIPLSLQTIPPPSTVSIGYRGRRHRRHCTLMATICARHGCVTVVLNFKFLRLRLGLPRRSDGGVSPRLS